MKGNIVGNLTRKVVFPNSWPGRDVGCIVCRGETTNQMGCDGTWIHEIEIFGELMVRAEPRGFSRWRDQQNGSLETGSLWFISGFYIPGRMKPGLPQQRQTQPETILYIATYCYILLLLYIIYCILIYTVHSCSCVRMRLWGKRQVNTWRYWGYGYSLLLTL